MNVNANTHVHTNENAPMIEQLTLLDTYENASEIASEIAQRDQEIAKLEQGVYQIHEMMQDLGNMVILQGETVTTIEDEITQAEATTEKGTEELQKADGYARKASKKMKYLLGTAIALGTGVGGLALLILL